MRVLAAGLFALCLGAPVGGAPVPKERADAERIVGTWKMTLDSRGGTDTNLELEFTQGGRMTIRQIHTNGQTTVYVGTYRVVGTELPYKVKLGTQVKAETLAIKKLTADVLIVVDPDGLKEEFSRVKKPETIDPKKLVGAWRQVEPKDGPQVTLEFTADGKLTGAAEMGAEKLKVSGTYRVEEDRLVTFTTLEGMEEETKGGGKVTKLTDDDLEMTDTNAIRLKLRRVASKK